MKKTLEKKLTSFFLWGSMMMILAQQCPIVVVAATKTTMITTNQIGTMNNGDVVFYAPLGAGKATPYAVNPYKVYNSTASRFVDLNPQQFSDYQYFYSNTSPYFNIKYDTNLSDDPTGIRGTTLSLDSSTIISLTLYDYNTTTKDHAYYRTSTPYQGLNVETRYDLVENTNTGIKDIMRCEYIITNASGTSMHIAGRWGGDTKLGALGDSLNYPNADRSLVMVDNPVPYIYNKTTNPNGFLYAGGEMQRISRFVDNQGNTAINPKGINGIPMTW